MSQMHANNGNPDNLDRDELEEQLVRARLVVPLLSSWVEVSGAR